MLSTRRPDRDLALPIAMSHMPKLPLISAPKLAPLTLTVWDLLLQSGLSGAPQHLPLNNRFKYDNYLSEDHHAAAANVVTLLTPWTPPSSWSPLSGPPWSQTCSLLKVYSSEM